jgi:hypothetical protein
VTYHWLTPIAPSIQLVELKNMPWWCRVVGSSMEFVACTTRESVLLIDIGGGLQGSEGKSVTLVMIRVLTK